MGDRLIDVDNVTPRRLYGFVRNQQLRDVPQALRRFVKFHNVVVGRACAGMRSAHPIGARDHDVQQAEAVVRRHGDVCSIQRHLRWIVERGALHWGGPSHVRGDARENPLEGRNQLWEDGAGFWSERNRTGEHLKTTYPSCH